MAKRKPIYPDPLRIDLACGQRKKDGFWGVDYKKCDGVDEVVDLLRFPWPWANNSVEEVHCSHFFEHVPQKLRVPFMEELYRVLKVGEKAIFICPYWSSMRAVQDPTHEWPSICEASFLYFNRGWLKQNGLDHYGIRCDFDFTYGFNLDGAHAGRNQEMQGFAARNYTNAVSDIFVTMTKRKWEE